MSANFLSSLLSFVKKIFDIEGIASIIGVEPKYIYIGAAIIVLLAIFSCVKRAARVGVTLFIIGFLIVFAGPFLQKTLLTNNGIEYHDKKLTMTVDGKEQTFDLSLIKSYSANEDGENTIITIDFKDDTQKTITVPTKVANIAVKIFKVGGKIVEAGGNAARQMEAEPSGG